MKRISCSTKVEIIDIKAIINHICVLFDLLSSFASGNIAKLIGLIMSILSTATTTKITTTGAISIPNTLKFQSRSLNIGVPSIVLLVEMLVSLTSR